MRHRIGESLPTSGEGSGVRSVIAERYGDGSAGPDAGEKEEVKLDVDILDLSDDPTVGRLVGEVRL
jgi:hypothetical protein